MPASRYLLSSLLVCLLLSLQSSDGRASSMPAALPSGASAKPTIPMLDEGKGFIHLDVSVTNAAGEPVSGLHREDFALLDEGQPQKIMSFHAFNDQSTQPDPPSQVILFIDTLGLSSDKIFRTEAGIKTFMLQNNGHLVQPVSIFGLSDNGFWTVRQHDSTDGNSLASDMVPGNRIFLNRRPQALRALGVIATGERRKRGRKVLLWIGPGCGPTTDVFPAVGGRATTGLFPGSRKEGQRSFARIYWFTQLLREARLSIDEFSIDQVGPCTNGYQQYLRGPRTVREADDRFLYKKILAIQSGGRVIDESQDLVFVMNRSLRRAATFYTLSFDPPVATQPHEYHELHVLVDKPGLVAQTNTSYYDEPFYSDQPNPALRRVTVEQLAQLLRGDTAQPIAQHLRGDDGVFASQGPELSASTGGIERAGLSKIELTERVSFAQLSAWTEEYRGRVLQQALIGAADASASLAPPPSEIPKLPAPDGAAQQHMLALTKKYLEQSIRKLPDFYATRTTVRYEDTPFFDSDKIAVDNQPLHIAETSKAKVLYRAGNEVVESQGSEPDESSRNYLITHGTFGPILAGAQHAVETPGQMKWVRWESSPQGNRAVFAFEVSEAESSDFEGGCCLPDAEGENAFRKQAGYHGEIAIDPATGTILRLQEDFDMREYVPVDRDDIVIDYGPVKIGGETYYCPVRSVAIARGRSIISLKADDLTFLSWGPYATKINDIRFTNYHVFRSESRILPGFQPDK